MSLRARLSSGQFASMTIYLPELFPTRVRGTAISLVFDTSRGVSVIVSAVGRLVDFFLGHIGAAGATISLIYVVGLRPRGNHCQREGLLWRQQRP